MSVGHGAKNALFNALLAAAKQNPGKKITVDVFMSFSGGPIAHFFDGSVRVEYRIYSQSEGLPEGDVGEPVSAGQFDSRGGNYVQFECGRRRSVGSMEFDRGNL